MDERDSSLMQEFRRRLPASVAARIRRLIVFGSRVTGGASEDSDLDVLALVDERTPEIERELDDAAYQVMWDHDFRPIISLKVLGESQFQAAVGSGLSFYRHVEKEGVSV